MTRRRWLWSFAARNLLRNRRRNLVTGIALASAYAGILVFTGYVVWVEKALRVQTVYLNQLGHLLIERPNALERQTTVPDRVLMTMAEQTEVTRLLRNEPGVAMIGRGLASYLLAVHDCLGLGVQATAIDMDIETKARELDDVKRWASDALPPKSNTITGADVDQSTIGVMPTPDLQRRLNREGSTECALSPTPANSLQLMGRTVDGYTAALETKVVGEQSTGIAMLDSHTLFMPLADLQHMLETDRVGYVAVYARSLFDLPSLYLHLRDGLAGTKLLVKPFFSGDVGQFYLGSVGFVAAVATLFLGMVAAVVALTLISLFSITISERGAEIGVLLALGFPERVIGKLFEAEAMILTFVSMVAGLGGGLLAGFTIGALHIDFAAPGLAKPVHLTIAWEPWVVLVIAAIFCVAAWLAVRVITRVKLQQSAVSLLQGSTTL